MHQDKKQFLHSKHLECLHMVIVRKILGEKRRKTAKKYVVVFLNSLGSLHDLCVLEVLCDPGRPFRGLRRHSDLHRHKLLHCRLLARLFL